MKKIYVIGSGWSSSSFIKNIDTNKYDVYVISPTNKFVYTPLLTQNIRKDTNVELKIKDINNNVKYIKDYINDFNNNKIIGKNNVYDDYDYLIFAYGGEINTFNIEGVKDNTLTINYDNLVKVREIINNNNNKINISIIGCGPVGVELIGNLIDIKDDKIKIYAIDGLDAPLKMYNSEIQKYIFNVWKKNNVNVMMNNYVSKIDKNNIYFGDDKIQYDIAFWCGGIKSTDLSNKINSIFKNKCKFGILVDKNLRIVNCNSNNIFAIGDCAYNGNIPTAQVAYQEGKYLADFFNNNLKSQSKFKYNHKGKICYIGNNISVYQNNDYYSKGKITGYLNSFIHLYNSINLKQRINIMKSFF